MPRGSCARCAKVAQALVESDYDELIDLLADLYRAELEALGGIADDQDGEDPTG